MKLGKIKEVAVHNLRTFGIFHRHLLGGNIHVFGSTHPRTPENVRFDQIFFFCGKTSNIVKYINTLLQAVSYLIINEFHKVMRFRVRSYERLNEFKPVWGLISVENLTSVSFLRVFTWIELKWNSKRYGFHIGHFDFHVNMIYSKRNE